MTTATPSTDSSSADTFDGAALMREFLPASPFVQHLGIELVEVSDGQATLRLPFREEVATIGRVVHGGALATLIDTAAMVASWAGAAPPEQPRGSTVALSVNFLAPADGEDVTATAQVVRRGRKLTTVQVEARTASGVHAATALVTYQVG